MARSREETRVTLFPFLSVLCAVIGVMVLFIVLTLGTRVVQQEQKYAERPGGVSTPQYGRSDVLAEGIDQRDYEALHAEALRLAQLLEERKQRLDQLKHRLSALQDLVELRKTELFVRVTRAPLRELAEPEPIVMVERERQPFQIVPKGRNARPLRLTPIFVEVKSAGYTVHPSGESFPPIRFSSGDEDLDKLDADPALREFLRGVDAQKTRKYLVFLIEPNGAAAFDGIRTYLAKNHDEVHMGWEPFSRTWILANTDNK